LLHGHLTGDNILFDDDGLIDISDFCVKSLSEIGGNSDAMAEVGGFSEKGGVQMQMSEYLQNVFQELSLVILLGKTDAVSRFRHLF
jgi:hypothetical protein